MITEFWRYPMANSRQAIKLENDSSNSLPSVSVQGNNVPIPTASFVNSSGSNSPASSLSSFDSSKQFFEIIFIDNFLLIITLIYLYVFYCSQGYNVLSNKHYIYTYIFIILVMCTFILLNLLIKIYYYIILVQFYFFRQ